MSQRLPSLHAAIHKWINRQPQSRLFDASVRINLQPSIRYIDLHLSNVVNNARFIGDRMKLTDTDVLCCPPPLFHCFGLVLGLLAVITHGSKIIYPSEVFEPEATLRALTEEKCTALHGVPAMFDAVFSLPHSNMDRTRLRTGIIAGSPVPRHLMELMFKDFGMTEYTSSYGKTMLDVAKALSGANAIF